MKEDLKQDTRGCARIISKLLFPAEKSLQASLTDELTNILSEIIFTHPDNSMKVLEKYFGKYVNTTRLVQPTLIDDRLLRHYLEVPDVFGPETRKLIVRKCEYTKSSLSEPQSVSILVLQISPSKHMDPACLDRVSYRAISSVAFRCPECEKLRLTNFVTRRYTFGWDDLMTFWSKRRFYAKCSKKHSFEVSKKLSIMYPPTR